MAEIIHCPKCHRPLQVPENYFGQTVQCPECRHMFTAISESVSAKHMILLRKITRSGRRFLPAGGCGSRCAPLSGRRFDHFLVVTEIDNYFLQSTYDKRYAESAVASADYFTQELIRILADNDASLMGASFPRS